MSQPFPKLSEWFRRTAARAEQGDAEPLEILEALAGAVGLAIFGGLDALSDAETKRLMKRGRRALLAAGPLSGDREDEPEVEDRQMAIALARAGLSLLEGKAMETLLGPGDPMHVPDGRLSSASRGALDGFSLAACALHIARCDTCRARVMVLTMATASATEPLRVAAATAVAMLRPDAGRVVITLDEPAVEIVLFEDDGARHVAIYAEASAPVRLVGDDLETVEMLAGYWLGALSPDATRIRGTLHVGDTTAPVDVGV
jgi:hypothetical protein